ncbi:MAG: hypothetical protein K8R68_04000 [Bacteroidales bacterium]|nr:hypothetical protein [Bacteroidales bacterium]
MKKIPLIFLIVFLTNSLCAQLTNEEFKVILKSEDIVILNEDMKVSFIGQKAFYINIIIEKEIEYQILTNAGNDYLNPFILPQPFDEVYKPHASTIRNELRLYDEINISEFDVHIIHPDGKIEDMALIKDSRKHKIVTENDRFGHLYSYNYSFRKLEPGEIIKIKYKYSIPFRHNWKQILSTRLFLETKIPRKKFNLNWVASLLPRS